MKRFFTLILTVLAIVETKAQALLNEIYTIPGAGKHEFFEFYNTSNALLSMDHYTIVTYFEEGTKKGFYVMDMPAMNIAGRGYFVGSSSMPFNYQGIVNATTSQFSWNNASFMINNNAYLKKWVVNNDVDANIDGNAFYDEETVPSNFNDFFAKSGGSGATYVVFVYNNGVLSNSFLGGTGGATNVPSYVLSMPQLFVDMSSASPDFSIDFSSYFGVHPEYVIQDVGTDNGYIRLGDGYCGEWTKSSAQANHSPGISNGGSTSSTGSVSITAVVVRGNNSNGSVVNYDVLNAPPTAFPVTMHIYVDNGSVSGVIDVNDTYIESNTEYSVNDGPFTTSFLPATAHVLIQTTTSVGCIDNIRFIPNIGVLPVKLIHFSASDNGLEWSVETNDNAMYFELERSLNNTVFEKVATISTTLQEGKENYVYRNSLPGYYRLKVVEKTNKSFYSNVVKISNVPEKSQQILVQYPVKSTLSFSYVATENDLVELSIYTINGQRIQTLQLPVYRGQHSYNIPLKNVTAGINVLQITNKEGRVQAKFIKQ